MMKNLYKKLGVLAVSASIFFGVNQEADAAKRRVVVEDHTGAWCGWCVRGTQTLRDLLEQYGDDFIPVAIHNGDAMAVSDIQSPLAQKIGLTGYPSGSVNRILFSGQSTVAVSDGYWPQYTKQILETPGLKDSWADVKVNWSVDGAGNLTAEVTVTADADASGDFGINLYVMEDGVTGSGSGYDQQNYLSGNASFKGHYYYDKPKVITGYEHDNVMRYMLSGYDGKLSPIGTTTIKKGDVFTKTFNQNISQRIQNKDNVWVVALVQNLSNSNYEIVNAIMDGKKILPSAGVEIANDGNVANKHTAGESVKETISLTNPNDFDITVNLEADASTSIIPQGWSVSFAQKTLTIKAGETVTTDATLKTGNTAGFAQISVKATVATTAEYKGKSTSTEFYSLSNTTKYAFFVISNNNAPIMQAFNNLSTYAASSAYIPYSDAIANAYPMKDFDLSIMNVDFTIRGALAEGSVMAGSLLEAMNSGKKVLLTAIIDGFFATGNPINGVTVAQEAKQLYNTFGIATYDPAAPITIAQQNGNNVSLIPLNVNGQSGDVDFDGLALTLNQYNQSSHPYYTYWVDRFKITNATTTTPILNYNNSGIPANASLAGVKVKLANGAKAIVTGFSFDLIADPGTRTNLLAKSIEWLLKTETTAPKISLSTETLNFGKTDVAKTMKVQVLNNGNADLVISDVQISNDVDGVFSVEDPSNSTVAAGKSVSIDVTYNPKAGKASSASLLISSNAGDKTVSLNGESSVTSVDGYLANTGIFTMSVSPNPVASQSVFSYELNTESAEYVNLQLIDLKGNVVAQLFDGVQTPGTHTINLNASEYANGQYYIIANLLGHNARFNVVVAK